MVEPPFTNEKYYVIRSRHDGYTTVGQYDATFFEGKGGAFWICGSDEAYLATEVEVLKEVDATW